MYVVGAIILSAFWEAHPECEAELRALHALLADTRPGELREMFRHAAEFDGTAAMLDLERTRVAIDINEAGRVVRVTGVTMREAE